MGTVIRSELSKKNKYWISKHRYYELKHFCLQYPEWRIALTSINYFGSLSNDEIKSTKISKPTEQKYETIEYYKTRMDMITRAIRETDEELYDYIFLGVTQARSYEWLQVNKQIPCSKNYYYERYRKFFYILDKIRG